MDRRTFLRCGVVGGTTVLAGCTGGSGDPRLRIRTWGHFEAAGSYTIEPEDGPTGTASIENEDAAGDVVPANRVRRIAAEAELVSLEPESPGEVDERIRLAIVDGESERVYEAASTSTLNERIRVDREF